MIAKALFGRDGDAGPHPHPGVREVGIAFLVDLTAWLGRWQGPVPSHVEYPLEPLRDIDDAALRLGRYVAPEVFDRWRQALQPFFEAGADFVVEVADVVIEPDPSGAPCCDIRFRDQSHARELDASVRQPRRWHLRLWVEPDGRHVLDARLRPG